MSSRFKFARAGAGITGAAALLLMAAAVPASADPATGVVDGGTEGYHVNVGNGGLGNLATSLIGFRLTDGTKLGMYCVEIHTNIDRDHEMVEQPWEEYPNPESPFNDNRDKINWVLHNGFPVKSTDDLAAKLTDGGASLNDGLSEKEAIAGTQAAVWHFSDATDLNRENPLPRDGDEAAAKDVVALYDFLTGDANGGIGDQPTPALQVSPTELSGKAGERIGPFTVNTTGTIDELKANLPEGVKITDVDGVELDASKIKNGSQLFLDVPADAAEGEANFELSASAKVDTGRLFVGKDYNEHHKTQSLIVAKAEESKITVTAGGNWAATPPPTSPPSSTSETAPPTTTTTTEAPPAPQPKNTGGLAETGASIMAPVIIGVVLLGAGVGTLLFLRRRRA
ncbi:MAG TPA: thioester domain-containing protein [Actinophytocola sp.]|jgi:TQXA domain-containing protein/LPXTG-motif cell wall-anchored protein|uniref:thioester domain-containing protein n=1 Tax=Actinophytocola sp. TaxID=1872138 RepID=UPI002F956C9E